MFISKITICSIKSLHIPGTTTAIDCMHFSSLHAVAIDVTLYHVSKYKHLLTMYNYRPSLSQELYAYKINGITMK